jgi:dTMP kinase
VSRGRLISVEGLDGSGKSTLCLGLADALQGRGLEIRSLREPGGVDAAERIRRLVHDPELEVGPRCEALLFAAARAQLVAEAIEPLLEAGVWVLLDRFVDSSLAYQGGGRELGIDEVAEINRFATQGLLPERTLLLTISTELGRERARSRGAAADRLEREHDAFFARVAAAYEVIARREPARIRALDAEQSPDRVLAAALSELEDLLPREQNPSPH